MSQSEVQPLLEVSVHVDAPVASVWPLVSDVTRYPEWSPQVVSTRLRVGFDTVGPGAQFTNRNARGDLVWTTHAEITAYEPERHVAFRVEENYAVWSFELVEQDGGTTVFHRRETPDGISDVSRELTDAVMGGQASFSQELLDGMRSTLEGIRGIAEAG